VLRLIENDAAVWPVAAAENVDVAAVVPAATAQLMLTPVDQLAGVIVAVAGQVTAVLPERVMLTVTLAAGCALRRRVTVALLPPATDWLAGEALIVGVVGLGDELGDGDGDGDWDCDGDGEGPGPCQPTPWPVTAVGAPGNVPTPVHEPLKPMLVDPPVAMLRVQSSGVAVTFCPDAFQLADQPGPHDSPLGRAKASVHPAQASPVFLTVRFAVKPLFQLLTV
jgi:hypothetical protein